MAGIVGRIAREGRPGSLARWQWPFCGGRGTAVTGARVLNDGRRHGLARGLLTGGGAFANSYATLGTLGVYEPVWEYDAPTLARDLGAHLLFGAATGVADTAMSREAHR